MFFKTLLYLMDYFNTVLKGPSIKLAGTSMPFCKLLTQAKIYFKFHLFSKSRIFDAARKYFWNSGNLKK